MDKRGTVLQKITVHLILVGLIFVVFFYSNAEKVEARGVKQQVLEKQIALLIDSSIPGMKFEVLKFNQYGYIEKIVIENGKVYVSVNGLPSVEGQPFFTSHQVNVREEQDKFIIEISGVRNFKL